MALALEDNKMEENKKTIGISSLITLLIVTTAMVGPGFFDEDKYYCETRPSLGLQECDSFSKYVAENGKCIKDDAPNLICRSGWLLVTDDTVFEESDVSYESIGDQWSCTAPPESSCVPI